MVRIDARQGLYLFLHLADAGKRTVMMNNVLGLLFHLPEGSGGAD